MRIFIASGIFHPDSGGPATYLYRLLPELQARGHEIRVLAYGNTPTIGYPYPLTRIPFQSLPIRLLKYARAYRAGAAWADLIYLNSLGLPRSGERHKPRVMKVVGDYAWERCVGRGWIPPTEDIDVFQHQRYAPHVEWAKTSRRREVQAMDRVIVPSEYLRNMVIGWGADPARVQVIYNALDSENYTIQRTHSEARAELGWDQHGKYLVTAARLTAWKGVDYLIDALTCLPDITLVVAGDGPQFDALRAQASARQVANRVLFLGKVAQERLALLLRAADYFALYSGYEGLSHTILEALYAGTPIIASARGGNPEIIRDGENGLLVPHPDRDALINALQRAFAGDTPARLAVGTQHGLEQFSWPSLVEQTTRTLEEVAGTRRMSPADLPAGSNGEDLAFVGARHASPSPSSDMERLGEVNLLMLSGDSSIALGQDGAFNRMLHRFSTYWNRIDVICPGAPGATPCQIAENVFVHPSPWHRLAQPWHIFRKGRALFAERHYDLVISHDFGIFLNGIGARLLTRGTGVPYVSEIHHVEGYPRAATRREQLYRALAMCYLRWVWPRAAAIRTVNTVEIPTLLDKLGIPANKILILPSLYIDFDLFRPIPDESRQFDVLFVGRLAPNKGLFTLIDAIAQVKRSHPDIRLAILGSGPLRKALDARIAALHLDQNVIFIPRTETADDLARIYNRAAMLVCASTSEGGPRVTVEAMACGIPVISTPVGVMAELIKDGENGLIFLWDAGQLADKILRLLTDESLRLQLAENGRQSVRKFDADHVIELYAQAYLDLIHRHQGQGTH